MANAGRLRGVFSPRLRPSSSFVKTAESLVSLPAAGMVRMAPTGVVHRSSARLAQNSQMSTSGFAAPWATALAVSITLPPPTARMSCAESASAFWTPSRASDSRGFGCTPDRTSNVTSADLNSVSTRSKSPLSFALCPPHTSSTRVMFRSFKSSGSFARLSPPNTICVGTQ